MTATAKAFLYGWNFNKFGPNLQNKHLEWWITTTKHHVPDYSFVSFNIASRCWHYVTAKHVFCVWQLSDKWQCQQVSLLTLSARSIQTILLWFSDWLRNIAWYRPWAETTVVAVGCGLLQYPNLISVISQSIQNLPHCHIYSINLDGKYNRWACVFWNISQTQAAICS